MFKITLPPNSPITAHVADMSSRARNAELIRLAEFGLAMQGGYIPAKIPTIASVPAVFKTELEVHSQEQEIGALSNTVDIPDLGDELLQFK